MENIEFDARLLKSIKIAIKRSDLQTNDSSNQTIATIIKRDLLEPESLNINFCSTNRLPMFSRCDIKENTVKLEDDIVLGQKSSEIFPSFYNRAPSLDSECVSRSRESNNRRSKRDRSESREKSSSPRGRHKSRRHNSRQVRSRESNNQDDIVLGQKSSEIFPSFYNRAPSLDSECVSRSRESNNRRSKRDRSESREKSSSPRGRHKSRRRNSRRVRSRESNNQDDIVLGQKSSQIFPSFYNRAPSLDSECVSRSRKSNNRRSKRDRSESREKSSSPRGQHKSRRRNRRRVRSKSRSQDRRSRNDYNPNTRYQRRRSRTPPNNYETYTRTSPPQEYIPKAQYTGYYKPTYGEFPSPEYMYNISYDQMMMPNIQYVAVQLPPQDESSM
ncbi:PREDICTED: uncharacterized protein DDB_G0287625-like isoform X2 [Nicrophorus vespilloides]|uniref:Uncharacterized protein DDB_G0287625-like isoform X2 n=1 Tax=Nicrophorus vespilloides TaxID=110193 RepID=A0ABM1N5H9_NICVS|nr:PREDICTED: uncharacterized protein DDB_G0287625-like isoform X2 [Nicrophorus vespilloides]